MVGELLLELLVRGSNPSGVGLLLGSIDRGWSTTGWRVASRTLGQGFKPLRCWTAPGIRKTGVGAPLVGKLLLELLVRCSNPSSGAGDLHVQSGNLRGLGSHMSNQGIPWRRYRETHSNEACTSL